MNLTCLSLWCALPIGYFYFNLPQQRHDLLRLVFLHRHVQLSFRVIFSHSRWTNSSRSRHTIRSDATVLDFNSFSIKSHAKTVL